MNQKIWVPNGSYRKKRGKEQSIDQARAEKQFRKYLLESAGKILFSMRDQSKSSLSRRAFIKLKFAPAIETSQVLS
jgi:hypothetical protein